MCKPTIKSLYKNSWTVSRNKQCFLDVEGNGIVGAQKVHTKRLQGLFI